MIRPMTLLPHVVAGCALLLVNTAAGAESVDDVLARVEKRARFARPMRADVRVVCEPACRTARAILLGRGDALYVEVEGGLRALVRPREVLVAENGRVAPAEPGKSLGDTGLLLADLAVFDRTRLRTPQISDEGPGEVVVTAEPAGSSVYALIVQTVDPTLDRVVKTLYYQGSVNTLAKMRRDAAFARVGDAPYPGEIRVEEMRTTKTTRLQLGWREAPEAPAALFEPAGLEKPSGLTF